MNSTRRPYLFDGNARHFRALWGSQSLSAEPQDAVLTFDAYAGIGISPTI